MTFPGGSVFDSPIVRGYRANSSTSATLFDIPDVQLPSTLNAVTRDVINDQQALNIGDIVRNAGGVTSSTDGFFLDNILVRGLQLGSRNFRKDGFFDPSYVPRDFQNIERIEILKGPASVLYGAGDPAGLVNLVTKKPLDAQFSNFLFTFGSYNQQRYTTDTNGRITRSGSLLYRVNVAHEDIDSFVDFNFMSRTIVAPAMTWVVAPTTTLTWQGEFHNDHRRGFQGTPALGGDPLALPPSRFVGEPTDFFRASEFRQSLVLSHELTEDWYLRIGGSSLFFQVPSLTTQVTDNTAAGFIGMPPLTPPEFYRQQNHFERDLEQSHSIIANLNGEFETGSIRHNAVIGSEFIYFNADTAGGFSLLSNQHPVLGQIGPNFNATAPTYGQELINVPLFNYNSPIFQQQRIGVYAQDYAELTPNWGLLAGARFDSLHQTFDRTFTTFLGSERFFSDETYYRVSPRVGLVYLPWEDRNFSVYGNYNQSFTPPGGLYSNPTVLPVLGELVEFGIKSEVLDGLTFNAAVFHVTRQNADLPTSTLLTQVSQERSQGAEFNLLGQITDRLSAVANYTYADTLISDPAAGSAAESKRIRNVPFNTLNAWGRYNLVQDEVRTIGAALGMIYLGDRPGSIDNTLTLPAFCRWDAGLYYTRGPFVANAYLENLFDIQYANSAISQFQVFQGAPRNGRVNVGWTF